MRLIVVGDCVALKHGTHQSSGSHGNSSCVDQKGIKRGRCLQTDCNDCDSYMHEPLRGAQCQYCGCFPTKHEKLDDSSDLLVSSQGTPGNLRVAPEIHIIDNGADTVIYDVDDAGNLVLPAGSKPNGQNIHPNFKAFTSANGCSSRNTEMSPRNYQVTSDNIKSHASRRDLYGFCVPSHLPIETSRDRSSIPVSDQQFIIKWISWAMWNFQIVTEKDFIEVAKLALRKYPELEFAFEEEDGVIGLAKALKSHLGNVWVLNGKQTKVDPAKKSKSTQPKPMQSPASTAVPNPAPKPIQNSAPKQTTPLQPKNIVVPSNQCVQSVTQSKHYDHTKLHIQKEMSKVGPSVPVLRTFLTSCRKERRLLAKTQRVSTQLEDFPCFQIPELVVWEFIQQEQLQCTYEDLKKRWLDALPNMVMYFASRMEKEISDVITEGQATIEILQCLTSPSCFGPPASGSNERDRSSYVLELFQGNIMPLFVFPQKGDPPRLFAIGSSEDDNLLTYVYVDGKVFYKGYVVDALIQVVACYFLFDAAPSADAQAAFSFLFGILMKEKAAEKYKIFSHVFSALECVWG